MRKINAKVLAGLIFTAVYLIIHLFLINDYGISWDFHYHHFAGLYHLGQKVPSVNNSYPIPFTPPDPRLTTKDPFGPFTQIIPTASYLLFYEKLHLLPFDSAYNLPSVIFGSLGILVLFLFLYEAVNFPVAFFAAVFLALLPTHFGYLHNNMKDVPNAFAFTLAVYLFWRLVKYKRWKDLVLAILSFAFAFNVKINSVMIPAVCLAWLILTPPPSGESWLHKFSLTPLRCLKALQKNWVVTLYFILSPIAALLVWWPFWRDPLGKLLELPHFYLLNTFNMPVLFNGIIYRSGINIPWIYPWVYIIITTPLGILFSFFAGCIVSIAQSVRKKDVYALFIIWLLIPLLRYFSPKVSAIDGMRHFMEAVYPLSAIAGIGFYFISQYLGKIVRNNKAGWLLFAVLAAGLIYNLVKFHPYQTSFYNALIGGMKGAEGKFDIDFWGAPQKDAVLWLDKNAPVNSYINIIMAQSSAAMYGRSDLQEKMNKKDVGKSNYTLILNKRSFFAVYPVEKYLEDALRDKKVVYTKTIDSVPLFWVIKN